MGLYDIIEDISEKQVLKTDTGDNRIFGVVLGTVVKNYSEQMPGRVCVSITTRDKEKNTLKWARIAMPSSGSKYGHYFVPEENDQVLVVFEQGNIERPYVIGCIPRMNDSFIKQAADEHNQYKKIITKNGNTILFEDNQEGEGDQDKIKILTAKNKHKVELDNEKKVIRISDEKGENQIEMKTEDGIMNITCAKKLNLKVGDNITISMNGENGTLTIDTNKYTLKTAEAMKVESSSSVTVSGTKMTLSGDSGVKVSSSGVMQIEGKPIKL